LKRLGLILAICLIAPIVALAQSVSIAGGVQFAGGPGPAGPTGPSGPAGSTGATGPQGNSLTSAEYAQAMASSGPWAIQGTGASTTALDRGTLYGFGRACTAPANLNVVGMVFHVDTTPNGGWLGGNPTATVSLRDMTTSTTLDSASLTAPQVSASVTNGYVVDMFAAPVSIVSGHAWRAGILYSAEGTAFANNSVVSGPWTGCTAIYTSTGGQAISAWTTGTAGGLDITFLYAPSTTLQNPLTVPTTRRILQLSGSFVNLDASLGAMVGSVINNTALRGVGISYTSATSSPANLVGIYPINRMTCGGVRVEEVDANFDQVVASTYITQSDYNWAVAQNGDFGAVLTPYWVLLDSAGSIASSVTDNFIYYATCPSDYISYPKMSTTSTATGIYTSPSSYSIAQVPGKMLYSWTNSSSAPYMLLGYDPNATWAGLQDFAHTAEHFARGRPVINLPTQLYALLGTTLAKQETNVYTQNLVGGDYDTNLQQPGANLVFSSTYGCQFDFGYRVQPGNTSGINGGCLTEPTSAGTYTLTVTLYDGRWNSTTPQGTVIATASTTVNVVSLSATTPNVYIASVDDSMGTDTGTCTSGVGCPASASPSWYNHAQAAIPNAQSVGIRSFDSTTPGTGTWTTAISGKFAAFYFTSVNPIGVSICNAGTDAIDSPFIFPSGVTASNYLGNVAFWANVRTGNTDAVYGGWGAALKRGGGSPFYGTDGYPVSPSAGMVVCDPSKGSGHFFQTNNGSAWVDSSPQPSSFVLSYADYIAANSWNSQLALATHLVIKLGSNDFNETSVPMPIAGPPAIALHQAFIASVHAYSGSINIAEMAPPAGMNQDAWGYGYTLVSTKPAYRWLRANMQAWFQQELLAFDSPGNRSSGLYFLSALTAINSQIGTAGSGYPMTTVPCDLYSGAAINGGGTYNTCTRLVPANTVHPSAPGTGYPAVGDVIAAWVQATR